MRRGAPFLLLVTVTIAACGRGDAGGSRGEIVVSAAASLTAAFNEIGAEFERENPGASVVFTFGPSDGLATQIAEGAPVDVFASASPRWMDAVEHDGPGVIDRADFATNSLAILVPSDNPAEIKGLEDLARTGVKLVLAAAGVPAGDYAREILSKAGLSDLVLPNVVSNEEDVAAVVSKVVSGDADAGIAYVTDAAAAPDGSVELIAIPPDANVVAAYPIAVIESSGEEDLARLFVAFVLGPGRRILEDNGFGPA
jgi:molybdate transport system substrate-binding protein